MATDVRQPHAGDTLDLGELALYHRINDHRVGLGQGQLELSRALTTTGNRHLVNLTEHDMYSHAWSADSGISEATDAMQIGGYPGIAFEILIDTTDAARALSGWLGSPSHRQGIETPGFRDIGVAFHGGKASVYFGAYGDPSGPPDIVGTAGADGASLTAFGDRMFAYAGDDAVWGLGGADTLYGNQGNDTLDGGDGADFLFGGQGGDVVHGAADADVLYGNMGADVLYGGAGADTLYGGQADDTLYGGAGDDVLLGNLGGDLIVVGAGEGSDRVEAFDPGQGDRLHLHGQGYGVGAGADGAVVLSLSGGGVVTLAGVPAASFSAAWIVG